MRYRKQPDAGSRKTWTTWQLDEDEKPYCADSVGSEYRLYLHIGNVYADALGLVPSRPPPFRRPSNLYLGSAAPFWLQSRGRALDAQMVVLLQWRRQMAMACCVTATSRDLFPGHTRSSILLRVAREIDATRSIHAACHSPSPPPFWRPVYKQRNGRTYLHTSTSGTRNIQAAPACPECYGFRGESLFTFPIRVFMYRSSTEQSGVPSIHLHFFFATRDMRHRASGQSLQVSYNFIEFGRLR
jgi:hypothetical protein